MWHHSSPCTAAGFSQCLHGDEGLVAAHFQLKFTVKGRTNLTALRADREPRGFLMLQLQLESPVGFL